MNDYTAAIKRIEHRQQMLDNLAAGHENRHRKPINIYLIHLQNGCYYVGQTIDLTGRIRAHTSSHPDTWVGQHRPIKHITTITLTTRNRAKAKDAEDAITLQIIDRFGHHKVRGGCFTPTATRPELVAWHADRIRPTPAGRRARPRPNNS